MWSAIEVKPKHFDWRDWDRMMDLAASNHLQVVIAELVTAAPEWASEKFPAAHYLGSDDRAVHSGISGSSATGGFPGLCLDNADVRKAAETFLTELVRRYRNHPALLGYDVWNENSFPGGSPGRMFCFCEATQKEFRAWLRKKYQSVENLGRAWGRFSYASWDQVHPPRDFSGYAEGLDWLEFRIDDAFRLLRWRVDLIRRLDPNHLIAAHGVAGTLDSLPSSTCDEWRSAAQVDVWGFTWVASRKGSEPWKQFHAVDLVRAGARGKPFWHAEAQAGPLWMQPQVTGRSREDGRITDDKDVRLWNLISCAGGATGILYPRWRPLLDGPLFGAFGAFGMDGSITPRAEMAGRVATWANEHPEIWKSKPVRGEVGIVFVPESELFNYVQQGDTRFYAESARGAYQAFFDSNIQADWVRIDDIAEYPLVYLPYPVMLRDSTIDQLRRYVQSGGHLVSEGLPGYFGERGRAGERQPNRGLDQLFGATERYVEFTPDLLENLSLKVRDHEIGGRLFRQEYSTGAARKVGEFSNGEAAAVENQFGQGAALLIGTFPGAAYFAHHAPETRAFFRELLDWAKLKPGLQVSDSAIKARLHQGPGRTYLWVINPTRARRDVTVTIDESFGTFGRAEDVWERRPVTMEGRAIHLSLDERNGAVLRLSK